MGLLHISDPLYTDGLDSRGLGERLASLSMCALSWQESWPSFLLEASCEVSFSGCILCCHCFLEFENVRVCVHECVRVYVCVREREWECM